MNDDEGFMMSKDMKLDDALTAAREQLQQTPVPEQDLMVARAHMLAAHAKAQAAVATPIYVPAGVKHQLVGQLAGATGAASAGMGKSVRHYFGQSNKWLISVVILILAGIWLNSPVNVSIKSNNMPGVSAYSSDGFMPLVDSSIWQQTRHAVVVPTQLAMTELASLGLPFDASRAAESVNAELLMNDNGVLIGVRLLSAHEVPQVPRKKSNDELNELNELNELELG